MIPPEIKKLGPEAEEIYLRALDKGEQKIPYCGLLILGRKKVGKTSLYRQLVGKEFKEDLESTRGIDNNTVDTVWVLDVEAWQEKKGTDAGEQFGDAVINMVVPQLPEKPSEGAHEEKGEKVVKEDDLMAKIQCISNKLVKLKERERHAAVHPPLPSPTITPTFPTPVHYFPSDVYTHPDHHPLQPFQTPSSPKPQRKEEPRLQPAPQRKDITQEEPPRRPKPKVVEKPSTVAQPPAVPKRSLPKPAPQDPTPLKENLAIPPPKISGSSGMLNRRQSGRLDSIVKRGKEEFKPIEPPLVLNALDFAGHKEYRPMHHCFIWRRAIYMVVFKIPDLLDESLRYSAIEEMRYWIHSIHAHIYPPDGSMRGAYKKVRRVFLVGTHRGKQKLSKESFIEINGLVKKIADDDRCVNHVCPVKLPDYGPSFFFPVENSIDKKDCLGGCYLVESGTKPLQEKIKAMCKNHQALPFLHESHPIKWLKFEEDLKDFKKPPIVRLQEVNAIAADCKITEEDAMNLALYFFHNTGKIIFLSELVIFTGSYV